MTDLDEARALAAAARADTSDGLEARELLPGVVDRLSHDLLKAQARGDHWKRVATEMERDRDRLAAQLRLAHSADAVDPERIAAYLRARGWSPCARSGPYWISDERPDTVLHVHRVATAVDYLKRMGLLVSDLAELDGCGELQVLADIEAAEPGARDV